MPLRSIVARYERITLLVLLLIVFWMPLGQAQEISQDDRWYTLYEDENITYQLDKTTFASRLTNDEYDIICWTRTVTKKDNSETIINQEYLGSLNGQDLRSRFIQGFTKGIHNNNIADWGIVPNNSFENKIFNKIVEYDRSRKDNN